MLLLLSQSAFSSCLKLWQDKKEQQSAQHKLHVCSFDHAQIKVASRSFRLSSNLFFSRRVQTASLISPLVPLLMFFTVVADAP